MRDQNVGAHALRMRRLPVSRRGGDGAVGRRVDAVDSQERAIQKVKNEGDVCAGPVGVVHHTTEQVTNYCLARHNGAAETATCGTDIVNDDDACATQRAATSTTTIDDTHTTN